MVQRLRSGRVTLACYADPELAARVDELAAAHDRGTGGRSPFLRRWLELTIYDPAIVARVIGTVVDVAPPQRRAGLSDSREDYYAERLNHESYVANPAPRERQSKPRRVTGQAQNPANTAPTKRRDSA